MTITPEQWRAIEQAGERPVELTDPNTNTTYFLIRADLYHELREVVEAVVCTSARFATRRTLPNCVPFPAGQFGFTADCVAQCEDMLSRRRISRTWTAG